MMERGVAEAISATPGYLERSGRPLQAAQLPGHAHALMSYSLSPIANGLTVNGSQGAETIKIVPVLQSQSETLLFLVRQSGLMRSRSRICVTVLRHSA